MSMSTHRSEKRSGGLESEDLDLLFPSPDTEPPSSTPARTPRDYKKAAAGEHDEVQNLNDEEAQPQNSDSEDVPPTFDEPWPDALEEVQSEGPEPPREQDVQALAKSADRSMVNNMKEPKPKTPNRVRSESLPSDREWFPMMRKILGAELPATAWRQS